jgi:preprotein translocase subunit SecE
LQVSLDREVLKTRKSIMAKSATVVREDKRDAQPAKAEKSAGKTAIQASANAGGQLTGGFTRAIDFLKDVRGEMRKVTTPSQEEVRNTTTIVIVTVFAFAAYFYVVDGILGRTMQTILHWLGGTH